MKGNMNFAMRIKKLREAKGESQADLAKLVGYQKQAVSHWENNGKVPRPPALEILAKHFDTTSDYLLGIEASAKPKSKNLYTVSDYGRRVLDAFFVLGKNEQRMILKIMESFPAYEVKEEQDKR